MGGKKKEIQENGNMPDLGVNWTAIRALEHNIDPQQEGESNADFRLRVSGELRGKRRIIEAHEAYQNALFDSGNEMLEYGLLGAVSQLLGGEQYSRDPVEQVGDD